MACDEDCGGDRVSRAVNPGPAGYAAQRPTALLLPIPVVQGSLKTGNEAPLGAQADDCVPGSIGPVAVHAADRTGAGRIGQGNRGGLTVGLARGRVAEEDERFRGQRRPSRGDVGFGGRRLAFLETLDGLEGEETGSRKGHGSDKQHYGPPAFVTGGPGTKDHACTLAALARPRSSGEASTARASRQPTRIRAAVGPT